MMCDMPRQAADLRRLAEAVERRRSELRISVDEAARRATMSNTTWHRVEDGKATRDTTYSRVDDVLGWPTGTCMQILDDPDYRPFPSEVTGGARYSQVPIEEDAVRQAITSATIATAPELTGAQIKALQERAIEELRRQGVLKAS